VLVDTFIVRPLLVPACAMLLWGGAKEEKQEDVKEKKPALRRVA